jgi:5-methylcytosine-specific restriction endonuclease McrA
MRGCSRCGRALPAGRVLTYCTECNRAYQAEWKAAKRWRKRTGYDELHAARRREELRGRGAFRSVEAGSDEDAYLLTVAQDPCAYCGERATELDHIVPGVDSIDNVTAACRSCNARKGTLSLLGWLIRRRLIADGYDEMREQWRLAA